MIMITRPLKGKLQIKLPYQKPPRNLNLLKDICGPRSRVTYNQMGYFEIAPIHLQKLIVKLPSTLGERLEVDLYGAKQTKCVAKCWDASSTTKWECECSCAGTNHGTGQPLDKQVSSDLSISTDYTVARYVIMPA